MAKSGLPNSWEALFLMSEADFSPLTVDKATARLKTETTDKGKSAVLSRLVELLEDGISESEFLEELKK